MIKPADFTPLLQKAHLEYYNQQYEKWAGSQTIMDSLSPFVVVDEALLVESGTTAPSDLAHTFKHLIGAYVSTYADAGPGVTYPTNVRVDIVTPMEWSAWYGDPVMQGTTQYPVMTYDGSVFRFYLSGPSGANLKISYLVECDEDTALNGTDTSTDFYLPFFDYYLDANYTVQYLSNGTSHLLTAGEVARDGSTSGTTVTGKSHELKWADYDKVNIVSFILRELGIGLQSADISQYAMALEQKQNVM